MEGRSAVWLPAALLLLEVLISAEAQNSPKYREVGGKLVLKPEPVSSPITSIAWKFNGGIVGEWHKETLPLEFSPAFDGRSSVDTTTGVLEISNMMTTDSGVYTVEINDRVQDGSHDVRVIKQVPEPEAVMRPLTCSHQSENCFLSCDGDITEAGPVTFYFKKGDGDWKKGEQNMTIINNEITWAVERFYCRMKNPLGEKDSEPMKNVFYVGSNAGAIAGSIVAVLALVGAGVGGGMYYLKKRKSSNITDPATGLSTKVNGNQQEAAPLNDMTPDSTPDSQRKCMKL